MNTITALIDKRRVGEMLARGWEYLGPPAGDDSEWAVRMRGPDPDNEPFRPVRLEDGTFSPVVRALV